MKLGRKICVLTLATVCLINSLSTVHYVEAVEITGGDRLKELAGKQKSKLNYVNQNRGNKEAKENFEKIQDIVVVDKKKKSYAKSYGGIYYNDNKKVVVQTTNKNSKEIKEILNETNNEVVIEEVENSYNELQTEYLEVSEQFCELVGESGDGNLNADEKALADNMIGVSIDVKNNTVVAYLDNVTEESKAQFKEYYNVEDVVFEEVEPAKDQATLIKLGQAIYTTNARGSVGMKAYYINSKGEKVKGFVTAGHMGEVGDSIYINGYSNTKIGKITKQKYSGKIDAAFVKITNSAYAPSRKVYYANSSGKIADKYTLESYSYLSDTYVGADLYKSGSTTYLTKGEVLNTSLTVKITDTNTVFTDLWAIDYNCAGGDSGGAVFDVNFNCIAGIHKGKHTGNTTYGFAVKWENITDAWDLYEY